MRQVLQHVGTGKLELADVPEPALRPGGVLVRSAVSLISVGTERMLLEFAAKSLIGKARERPDLVRQVMEKARRDGIVPTMRAVTTRLQRPLALGYSCAGEVIEVGSGVEDYSPGARVACAGMGYASHAETIFVPRNLTVPVPDGVSLEDAAYVTLGAIALQGIRTADMRVGESAAVIGLGLLGLLTVQILTASGCRVIGVDLDPAKVQQARDLGAHHAMERSGDVERAVDDFTDGLGVDAAIITAATESDDPVELAGSLCRDRGRVVVVGAVGMTVPRKVYYEKELELRLSRSYGPGRYDSGYEEDGIDYPYGYVRWTERRNMAEFLRLVAEGTVTPARLTSHRFPIERALDAYGLVSTPPPGEALCGVLLTYSLPRPERGATVTVTSRALSREHIGIGFIGAGNFAQAVLLPEFRKAEGAQLVSVATRSGVAARSVAERFGFRSATTDIAALLGDPQVDAVVIATRHGSHASLAARALRAGKAVFLEKPLAIDEAGLSEVLEAARTSGRLLAVGFNRRFSALAAELKAHFPEGAPLSLAYRINAGPIPAGSWLHSVEEGGGRIVGEVCHFVDLLQFLAADHPVEAFALPLAGPEARHQDTVAVTLRFARGSVATVAYYCTGDRSFPKERIEAFGGGGVAVLDDFRSLLLSRDGRTRRRRLLVQDKGFGNEVEAFLRGVRSGTAPIPLESLAATTRATFAIETALRTGVPVRVSHG